MFGLSGVKDFPIGRLKVITTLLGVLFGEITVVGMISAGVRQEISRGDRWILVGRGENS